MRAIQLGSDRMQHDAAEEVEADRLLPRRRIGFEIAVALGMGFCFGSAVDTGMGMGHDRMRGTGTRVLATGHVSFAGMMEQVTQLESEVAPEKRAQEMWHAGMETVKALDHMGGTASAVRARRLSAGTALEELARRLGCSGAAVEAPETLPCYTVSAVVVLETRRVAGTDIGQEAQARVLLRMIHVWMAALAKWSGSMVLATALYRRPGTGLAGLATRLYDIAAAVAVLAIQLSVVLARLPSAVVGMHACAKNASMAAALETQLSRHVSDTVAAGGSLCGHGSRVC